MANKSPLQHSSMNATAKNLLSNTSQMSGTSKNSISNANTNLGSSSSSMPLPKDIMSFHDQMKKNRPPTKQSDGFPSNTANPLMNPNQMRNIQLSTLPSNQTVVPPMRRPAAGNSPQQVLLSSDDEIMDDSLVGK